jgi:hypothetical protein
VRPISIGRRVTYVFKCAGSVITSPYATRANKQDSRTDQASHCAEQRQQCCCADNWILYSTGHPRYIVDTAVDLVRQVEDRRAGYIPHSQCRNTAGRFPRLMWSVWVMIVLRYGLSITVVLVVGNGER